MVFNNPCCIITVTGSSTINHLAAFSFASLLTDICTSTIGLSYKRLKQSSHNNKYAEVFIFHILCSIE